jgi:hypothetical protein
MHGQCTAIGAPSPIPGLLIRAGLGSIGRECIGAIRSLMPDTILKREDEKCAQLLHLTGSSPTGAKNGLDRCRISAQMLTEKALVCFAQCMCDDDPHMTVGWKVLDQIIVAEEFLESIRLANNLRDR